MDELKELLDIDVEIEKHLVMSATTKTSDGMELLENFAVCRPDRVIFTKVDETMTHGLILNILQRRKAALSYRAYRMIWSQLVQKSWQNFSASLTWRKAARLPTSSYVQRTSSSI